MIIDIHVYIDKDTVDTSLSFSSKTILIIRFYIFIECERNEIMDVGIIWNTFV